ncbi:MULTISPECIES: hypothetical protein [unclassified Rhizobium]|uniref:hypothetical protein n=1 Tax=unclassified Rhizobium TaxID=2613769 RepID=UPI000EAA46A5|nr:MULTISPECIES: hypothetical protein [unclassified Rhizobium]AYG68911.1 hypothetical protein CCGE531_22845 [Rhizobium sp. CCGE531]AYG75297.1 hypothetical protein CCGE532_22330 [Rhizobium sp. CCGE532]
MQQVADDNALDNNVIAGVSSQQSSGGREALLKCLVSGGDERLDCDAASGLNMYGYGPAPRPGDLAFGSSTASTISASAFAEVDTYYAGLVREMETGSAAAIYEREIGRVRLDLLRLLGLNRVAGQPHVDAILATSGTDIHLFAASLLAREDDRALMTVTLMGNETGSGVMTASAGRHFMGRVSSDRAVAKGEELRPGDATRNATIAVRNKDGSLRADSEVEEELRGLIELGRVAGLRCLLVVTDVSKTSLLAPSLETVLRLKARFGDALDIMIDACQFRLAAATIRAYLAHGFMVALTGSKFLAGPIFSGALLCPPQMSERFKHRHLPAALADYCGKAEWPKGWAARETLSERANFGLLLRWKAALFELQSFVALPEEQVIAVLSTFAEAMTARLANDPAFALLESRPLDRRCLWGVPSVRHWDEIPSIFSFYLRDAGNADVLNAAETAAVYKELAIEEDGFAAVRIGQPVRCADFGEMPASALRICLSAPLVVRACESAEALASVIDQAMLVLDRTAEIAARHASMPAVRLASA